MYITLQSVKRNLGLFNLEIEDLILGGIFGIVFTILFLLHLYTPSLIFISLGIIGLFPVEFSKCNRVYKLFILFFKFMLKKKNYYFYNE